MHGQGPGLCSLGARRPTPEGSPCRPSSLTWASPAPPCSPPLRCAGYCPGERLPCRGPRAPRCPPGHFGVTRCLPAWRVRSAPDGRRRPQSCLETWAPPLVRLRVRVLPRRDPSPLSRPPLASLRGARLRVPPTPPGQRSCRASSFESSSILTRGPGRWGGAVSPPLTFVACCAAGFRGSPRARLRQAWPL